MKDQFYPNGLLFAWYNYKEKCVYVYSDKHNKHSPIAEFKIKTLTRTVK